MVKSGKEVIDEFMSNLDKILGTDKKTIDVFSDLYKQGKLTDKNLLNALDRIIAEEIKNIRITDGED